MIIESGRFQLPMYDTPGLDILKLWDGLDAWHSGQTVESHATGIGQLIVAGEEDLPDPTTAPYGDRFEYDVQPGEYEEGDMILEMLKRGVAHHLESSGVQSHDNQFFDMAIGFYEEDHRQPWHADRPGATDLILRHTVSRPAQGRIWPTRFSRANVTNTDLGSHGDHLYPDRIQADRANLWVPKQGELVCFVAHSTLHEGPPVPPKTKNSWREVYTATTVLTRKKVRRYFLW